MTLPSTSIPMPRSRTLTRVALPTLIVATAVALLAWASWRAWAPLTVVVVEPVVVRTTTVGEATPTQPPQGAGPVIQAPGWIEPSPFPTRVAALVPSVVKEVLVLEGDTVTTGQVVATLVDDEERLALRRADAEVLLRSSELAALQDEVDRKARLLATGAVSQGEVTRLGFRRDGARATLAQSEVARDEAQLSLERTQVRAPITGVVMARLATPGALVGMLPEDSTLLQMFDPSSLQVKVDVPLADAGRLAAGQRASVQVDALPGKVIVGRVIRLVQQADIAKNTVQVKVLLESPPLGLVPDMLARVRIETGAIRTGDDAVSGSAGRTEIVAPERALAGLAMNASGSRTGTVAVVIDVRDGVGTVQMRAIDAASTADAQGWTLVMSGLRPGDLIVVGDSRSLAEGQSVRVKELTALGTGGHDGHN